MKTTKTRTNLTLHPRIRQIAARLMEERAFNDFSPFVEQLIREEGERRFPTPPEHHPAYLNAPAPPYRYSPGSHQSVANPPTGDEDLPAAAKLAAAATAEALGERASRATSTGTVNPVKPRKTTPS